MLDEEAIKKRVNEIVPRRIVEGMITGRVPIMRNLETLIEQFNRASEIDRFSQVFIGEILWAEVDGVRTTMVNAWVAGLSPEEKAALVTHATKLVQETANKLGYESGEAWFKDIGEKVFSGLEIGLTT